jgi:hypothetical protein
MLSVKTRAVRVVVAHGMIPSFFAFGARSDLTCGAVSARMIGEFRFGFATNWCGFATKPKGVG